MSNRMTDELLKVCSVQDIEREGVRRFDHGDKTFAIYRSPQGEFFATDGHCTHEKTHLADGLVIDYTIECPRHGGQFNYKSGEALGAPVCIDLRTYRVEVRDGQVMLDPGQR